jgi:hypothetical protein
MAFLAVLSPRSGFRNVALLRFGRLGSGPHGRSAFARSLRCAPHSALLPNGHLCGLGKRALAKPRYEMRFWNEF